MLIVDDHLCIIDLIDEIICADRLLKTAGKATAGLRAIELANQLHPDILVLDVMLPDISGIETLRRIKKETPNVRVLVFTARHDSHTVCALMKSGINGFVCKQGPLCDLRQALHAVALGNSWYCKDFDPAVRMAISTPNLPGEEILALLTTREHEVATLIARSYSSKQVAFRLGISVKTAENHRAALMHKLGVRDVAGLVRFAIRTGIVDPTLE